jgi:hypothetical protein
MPFAEAGSGRLRIHGASRHDSATRRISVLGVAASILARQAIAARSIRCKQDRSERTTSSTHAGSEARHSPSWNSVARQQRFEIRSDVLPRGECVRCWFAASSAWRSGAELQADMETSSCDIRLFPKTVVRRHQWHVCFGPKPEAPATTKQPCGAGGIDV